MANPQAVFPDCSVWTGLRYQQRQTMQEAFSHPSDRQHPFDRLLAFDPVRVAPAQPGFATPVVVSDSLRAAMNQNQMRQRWYAAHRYFRVHRRLQSDAVALIQTYAHYPFVQLGKALRVAFALDFPFVPDPLEPVQQ